MFNSSHDRRSFADTIKTGSLSNEISTYRQNGGLTINHHTYGLSGSSDYQGLHSNHSQPSIDGQNKAYPDVSKTSYNYDLSGIGVNYGDNFYESKGNTDGSSSSSPGFVYVQTNAADGNQIVVYQRADDGKLSYLEKVSTGGRGSGGGIDPLQSESSLVLSEDQHFLFAVNSGSGTITSFATTPKGLVRVDQESTDGAFPTSIAVHGDLLYTLNASGNRNITGFHILKNGHLEHLNNSTRGVDGNNFDVGASTIGFSPDGKFIVVSERLANKFSVYKVNSDGTTDQPVTSPSVANNPFGLYFTPQGTLLSSEANTPQATVSSYSINSDGSLKPISSSVPTFAGGTCWVVTTGDGHIAISSNTPSNSLSSFLVSPSGELNYASTTSLPSGATPLDITTTHNSPYLYTLNAAAGSVSAFRVEDNGQINLIDTISEGLQGTSGLQGISAA